MESLKRSHLLRAHHPVVFFSNGLGDHLLSLPAIRALCQLFPDALTLVCQQRARSLFFSDLSFRRVYGGELHASSARLFDPRAVYQEIRECDLLISLNPWHS